MHSIPTENQQNAIAGEQQKTTNKKWIEIITESDGNCGIQSRTIKLLLLRSLSLHWMNEWSLICVSHRTSGRCHRTIATLHSDGTLSQNCLSRTSVMIRLAFSNWFLYKWKYSDSIARQFYFLNFSNGEIYEITTQ